MRVGCLLLVGLPLLLLGLGLTTVSLWSVVTATYWPGWREVLSTTGVTFGIGLAFLSGSLGVCGAGRIADTLLELGRIRRGKAHPSEP